MGSGSGDLVDEMVCVISLVGNGCIGIDAVDEILGQRDVVALAGTGDQADRKTKQKRSSAEPAKVVRNSVAIQPI
ncbi:hypothetical protein [Rhizobium ruizarguesonis]|uniref:hypothetical protein n=1 Tax=Rhizobium ruizarguesonis TaxID=2081791 RepID=UPI0037CAD624